MLPRAKIIGRVLHLMECLKADQRCKTCKQRLDPKGQEQLLRHSGFPGSKGAFLRRQSPVFAKRHLTRERSSI